MRWGTELLGGGRARFNLWAPDRDSVMLELDGAPALAMQQADDGWFTAETDATAGAKYRFRLDADLAVPDPASRQQDGGVHGWSVLCDPAAYRWQTAGWQGRPWAETVILEVHAGALGGFAGIGAMLPDIARQGITAVQLMPVAAFAGTRNWGYDGVLPYAVADAYGTPDELKALVDAAHAAGLMVFLDVVYNHFGPDGNYLGAYAAGFFDEHAHTPWGGAVAVSRDPVRRYFIDNALMWLDEYRIDGLRFDAVHAIADNGFLDDMARQIRAALPDRHTHLVLENENNDPDRLAPGLYDAQWNDDFHNVLHVILTGEREGYYDSFADRPTERLARCLAEGFIYQGEVCGHGPRGKPSAHLPAGRFVTFLQNHDQVGNRALGERLLTLTDPARLRAATALQLLCPQIPLLFMGETEGSTTPFLFFTDFHDELADAVRNGRRKEFAHFAAFSDPEAREAIPDPNDPATFTRSMPEPGADAPEWRGFYSDLLALRATYVVPGIEGARSAGVEVLGEGAIAASWLLGDGCTLGLTFNLGDTPVDFPEPEGRVLFELGEHGAPASFAAWIAR